MKKTRNCNVKNWKSNSPIASILDNGIRLSREAHSSPDQILSPHRICLKWFFASASLMFTVCDGSLARPFCWLRISRIGSAWPKSSLNFKKLLLQLVPLSKSHRQTCPWFILRFHQKFRDGNHCIHHFTIIRNGKNNAKLRCDFCMVKNDECRAILDRILSTSKFDGRTNWNTLTELFILFMNKPFVFHTDKSRKNSKIKMKINFVWREIHVVRAHIEWRFFILILHTLGLDGA